MRFWCVLFKAKKKKRNYCLCFIYFKKYEIKQLFLKKKKIGNQNKDFYKYPSFSGTHFNGSVYVTCMFLIVFLYCVKEFFLLPHTIYFYLNQPTNAIQLFIQTNK